MTKNLITRMNKKLAPLRAKNDVTHAILLNCMNERTKSRFELVVTSYGRNKYLDDHIKKTKRRPIIAPAIAVWLLIKVNFKVRKSFLRVR